VEFKKKVLGVNIYIVQGLAVAISEKKKEKEL